jgi:hypothetical protein
MRDFDSIVEQFRNKELNVEQWNFCINHGQTFAAYIMGEGAEQCLACKKGFATKQEIVDLYNSLGVTRILPI